MKLSELLEDFAFQDKEDELLFLVKKFGKKVNTAKYKQILAKYESMGPLEFSVDIKIGIHTPDGARVKEIDIT